MEEEEACNVGGEPEEEGEEEGDGKANGIHVSNRSSSNAEEEDEASPSLHPFEYITK